MSTIALNTDALKIGSSSGESFVTLLSGDNKNLLSQIGNEQVSCIVQDEPYGENPNPVDVAEYMRAALSGADYMRTGGGIGNEKWDCDIPPISHRREQFRVLKQGGYALCFTSNKNVDLVMMGLRIAGFKIIDLIAWVHTQGVPKGHKIDPILEKDPYLHQFFGSRRDLSSSMEIIVVAQKPIVDKTAIENLKENGTGLLNVGDCMVTNHYGETRYPKNVILENRPLVDSLMKGQSDKFLKIDPLPIEENVEHALYFKKPSTKEKDLGLENEDVPDTHFSMFRKNEIKGKNPHSTVKPLALMRYLVRLVSRPNDIVLDCFVGSGTTGIAAILENRRFLGAELMPDHFDIAARKIKNIYLQNEMEYLIARRNHIAAILGQINSLEKNPKSLTEQRLKLKNEIELRNLNQEIDFLTKKAA